MEFPPYSSECYSDPSVGVNPDLAYDCGKPRGPIWKAAWAGLPEKWPGAYEIVQAYNISNDEMSAMVGKADLDGVDIDAVVSDWMTANKERWSGWIAN